jgi:hypothetical protein
VSTGGSGGSRARALVVVVVAASLAFGLYFTYNAYLNQSFPSRTVDGTTYGTIVYSRFNGTEYFFRIQWNSAGNYTPLFAQVTSNEFSTNVYDLGLGPLTKGQSMDLPFPIENPSLSLSDVYLYIAVQNNTGGGQFTIDYHISSATAVPGNIVP